MKPKQFYEIGRETLFPLFFLWKPVTRVKNGWSSNLTGCSPQSTPEPGGVAGWRGGGGSGTEPAGPHSRLPHSLGSPSVVRPEQGGRDVQAGPRAVAGGPRAAPTPAGAPRSVRGSGPPDPAPQPLGPRPPAAPTPPGVIRTRGTCQDARPTRTSAPARPRGPSAAPQQRLPELRRHLLHRPGPARTSEP